MGVSSTMTDDTWNTLVLDVADSSMSNPGTDTSVTVIASSSKIHPSRLGSTVVLQRMSYPKSHNQRRIVWCRWLV